MKKDMPIEIEIDVIEAGQPRPQRPGPEPSNTKGLRPFPLPDRPGRMPPGPRAYTPPPRARLFLWVCKYLVMGVSPAAPTVADRGRALPLFTELPAGGIRTR
jgi:hypothetical protein